MAIPPRYGTLWMGDLESYMDETFLKQAFTIMGENLLHAKIIKNKFTGYSSSLPVGYGFLEFGDEQTAQRVLHRCNGKLIPNASPPKRFKLNHASYGKEHLQQKEHSLFVGDLSSEVDDLALYTAFSSKYPSVKAAKVVLDQSGVSKGYGFVRFTNENEYQVALVEMQNALVVGTKPIRVSVATPKSRPFTPTAPGTDYRNYYQYSSYDYQNYYAAWQGYQQYYNYNYDQSQYAQYDPATYQQQMQQYYDMAYEVPESVAVEDPADTALSEHDEPLDVEQHNEEVMNRNEEFYKLLDDSRWLPTEGLDPPLIPVK